MSIAHLHLLGYRCLDGDDGEIVVKVLTADGRAGSALVAVASAESASRLRFLGDALALFFNSGGTADEFRAIAEALSSLPSYTPPLEFAATVRAGEDLDSLFREPDGGIVAVRQDYSARRITAGVADAMIADGRVDAADIFNEA